MKLSRPPVVAIMGHIDHGKSTLLDYIRKSRVVASEAGGITQHVSVYEVEHEKEDPVTGEVAKAKITFLDTPGHEAFRAIRARGARAADIAVLVVSAEDAVKPQTLEAYQWIKAEEIPFIIGITKIDKPEANVDRVKQSLAENDIFVEGYGGTVPVVALSAKTGEGVEDLLEMILLVADLENLSGETDRWGSGAIIESRLDAKIGIVAVGIIKDGTVRVGQVAASIGTVAPLRFLLDAEGRQVQELTFSSPVQIAGWDSLPLVGASFEIFDDKVAAQFYADSEAAKADIPAKEIKNDEELAPLPLIIKADAAGSLEAILYELDKLSRERIAVRVVSAAVGTVSENDVKTAIATPGIIVLGFNTKTDSQAAALAERSNVGIEIFDVIYKLTERVANLLDEHEPKIEVEEVLGTAKVLKIFSATKDKQVLGARVENGTLKKGSAVKVLRQDNEIGRGTIKELQQAKISTSSVDKGVECGLMVESKIDIAAGDILESIVLVTK